MKTRVNFLVFASLIIGIGVLNGCKKEPDPVFLPTVATSSVSHITSQSVIVEGLITADGGAEVTACGFCWSTRQEPTINDNKTFAGTGTGDFVSLITGLTPDTDYYVRSYATNSAGTAYGKEIAFSSLDFSSDVDVFTSDIVSYSSTSAVVSGNVLNGQTWSELAGSGVCWNTSGDPTTADNKTMNDVSFTGFFTSNLTGLSGGTTYFVRAYAVFVNGNTVYGNVLRFTTPLSAGNISDLPLGGRYGAVGFSIGTKVYIGLGIGESDFPSNDFWEWDTTSRQWKRLANFPEFGGGSVVGFSIGTKGYISMLSIWSGTGYPANELWEYDPATDIWTQKASLPTTPGRGSVIGFSIGTKGYVGIGHKENYTGLPPEYYNDFWEWDQSTNIWKKKADFPGNARSGAVGFSIGKKGYIGTGGNSNSFTSEFWEWDQVTDVWIKKADFAGNPRQGAVGFSIGEKGYIGTGGSGIQTLNLFQDFWEWDQKSNAWTKVADFSGGPRYGAFCVPVGNKAYIGTGSDYIKAYLSDFYEYDPNILQSGQ
ncbi:hypothetical protein EG832_02755 [bacterium]|nr:hypothetical protein [bacterium]